MLTLNKKVKGLGLPSLPTKTHASQSVALFHRVTLFASETFLRLRLGKPLCTRCHGFWLRSVAFVHCFQTRWPIRSAHHNIDQRLARFKYISYNRMDIPLKVEESGHKNGIDIFGEGC